MIKICPECKIEKPYSDFRKNKAKSNGLQTYCIPCEKIRQHAWYVKNSTWRKKVAHDSRQVTSQRNQRYVLEYLSTHSCVDCPEADVIVLDFDHVRGTKVMDIAHMMSNDSSLDRIKSEIAKCEVRCSNCHRRKTSKQFGWWRSDLVAKR